MEQSSISFEEFARQAFRVVAGKHMYVTVDAVGRPVVTVAETSKVPDLWLFGRRLEGYKAKSPFGASYHYEAA